MRESQRKKSPIRVGPIEDGQRFLPPPQQDGCLRPPGLQVITTYLVHKAIHLTRIVTNLRV